MQLCQSINFILDKTHYGKYLNSSTKYRSQTEQSRRSIQDHVSQITSSLEDFSEFIIDANSSHQMTKEDIIDRIAHLGSLIHGPFATIITTRRCWVIAETCYEWKRNGNLSITDMRNKHKDSISILKPQRQ